MIPVIISALVLSGCEKTVKTADGVVLTAEDCRIEKQLTSKEDKGTRWGKEIACNSFYKKAGSFEEAMKTSVKNNYELMCNSGYKFAGNSISNTILERLCKDAKQGKLK